MTKKPRFVWTYELAMAAAQDAANRRMRAAGRRAWSQSDRNEAERVFNLLFPSPKTVGKEGAK